MTAEERVDEVERLETLGRLAGGVAHDFNNLLTGILLYCDLLCGSLPADNRLHQYVNEIRTASEHGAALTRELLAVARKQTRQSLPVLLNDVVTSTENLIRRLAGEQIELITVLDSDADAVLADPAQARQVLLNLVLNARDAMPGGGRITVATNRATFPDGRSSTVLSVRDAGCGMAPATRARIFEPFFTTKQPGKGTGFGLATVNRIVAESGGLIEVESEPGKGTCIKIYFPVVPEPNLAARTSAGGARAGITGDLSC